MVCALIIVDKKLKECFINSFFCVLELDFQMILHIYYSKKNKIHVKLTKELLNKLHIKYIKEK